MNPVLLGGDNSHYEHARVVAIRKNPSPCDTIEGFLSHMLRKLKSKVDFNDLGL